MSTFIVEGALMKIIKALAGIKLDKRQRGHSDRRGYPNRGRKLVEITSQNPFGRNMTEPVLFVFVFRLQLRSARL